MRPTARPPALSRTHEYSSTPLPHARQLFPALRFGAGWPYAPHGQCRPARIISPTVRRCAASSFYPIVLLACGYRRRCLSLIAHSKPSGHAGQNPLLCLSCEQRNGPQTLVVVASVSLVVYVFGLPAFTLGITMYLNYTNQMKHPGCNSPPLRPATSFDTLTPCLRPACSSTRHP
jgi:hypothetical protein